MTELLIDETDKIIASFPVREKTLGTGLLIITLKKIIFEGKDGTHHEKELKKFLTSKIKKKNQIDITVDSVADAGPIKYEYKTKTNSNIKIQTHLETAYANLVNSGLEEGNEPVKIFHPTIPVHIPEENIWNDCWLDEQRGIFCTLNKGILQIASDYKERPEYTKYNPIVGIDCFYKNSKDVLFYQTLPYIEDNEKTVTVLLQTIKESQLTREMIKLRKEGKMYYNTEDERLVPHRVLPIPIPMTEQEYKLHCQTTGTEYITPEKRIAIWRYIEENENWSNKEFEDNEFKKIMDKLGKNHKEIPMPEMKKYGDIILEMAKTVDMKSWRKGEEYKKQNQYSDRRIETKNIDEKFIVVGYEIYKGAKMFNDIKYMISKLINLKMVKDSLTNHEGEGFTLEINEKTIECYERLINLDLENAIKIRDTMNQVGCINNNGNLRSIVPIEIDMAIEYLTKMPQSEISVVKIP